MKAQISFVEYLVAFVIFVIFLGYFSIQILKVVPEYLNRMRGVTIMSETYQISEILVNDPGYPIDWTKDNVQRLGLSDETKNITNYLSLRKINEIGSSCTPGYDKIKASLASDQDFSIILINSSSGNNLIDCHPTTTAVREIKTTVRRIVSFDSSYGELIIQMW